MIKSLELENVGPVSGLALELAPRMNLLTGDNGLGKSFLQRITVRLVGVDWSEG